MTEGGGQPASRPRAGLPPHPVPRLGSPARLARLVDIGYGGWGGWRRTVATQIAYLAGSFEPGAPASLGGVARLVFVCLGNLNRSPFGAALARQRGIAAVSIGLQAAEGMAVSPRTQRCAAAFGADLRSHAPLDISAHDPLPGDLLLVMEARHLHELRGRGIPAAQVAMLGRWASPQRLHLEDPQGRPDDYLRCCFGLIHSAVDRLVDDLRSAGAPCVGEAGPTGPLPTVATDPR